MSGWQPIETAPKDGTIVRIFYEDGVQSERYWKRGWCKDIGWPAASNYRLAKATHWHPLPDAPA